MSETLAFIGGGNMAFAIVGGLLRGGRAAASIVVVEPSAAAREKLLGLNAGLVLLTEAGPALEAARLVVWAVKPQFFEAAAAPCRAHIGGAVQLSIMAGVPCRRITQASGGTAVVRAMPNTPALIGRGIAGLFATPEVSAAQRDAAEAVLAPTGRLEWVAHEADLDAVTALSASGPAYAFYLLEAMQQAGAQMGLPPEQARVLAQETLAGAAALAIASPDSPQTLRQQVTSKGGTTHAALTVMEEAGVKDTVVRALLAARQRAEELGRGGS
jgi:pyrroline-5-carboxylate reductase